MTTGNDTLTFSNLSGLVNITNGTYAEFVLELSNVSTWLQGGVAG
jgi:hypothetical protein